MSASAPNPRVTAGVVAAPQRAPVGVVFVVGAAFEHAATTAQAALNCRRDEANARLAEANSLAAQYREAATAFNAVGTQLQAEVAEFNAR